MKHFEYEKPLELDPYLDQFRIPDFEDSLDFPHMFPDDMWSEFE